MRPFVLVAATALAIGVSTLSAAASDTLLRDNSFRPDHAGTTHQIGMQIWHSSQTPKRSNTIHHPDGRVSQCIRWDHGKCLKMTRPEWPDTGKPTKPGKPQHLQVPTKPGDKPRPSPLKGPYGGTASSGNSAQR